MYNKYKKDNIYLRLNRVNSTFKKYNKENILIGEIGSLIYAKNNNVCTDYFFNVVNSSYLKLLNDMGVKRICLSPELSLDNLKLMLNNYVCNAKIEYIVYGTIEYMIMKYNLFNNLNLKNDKRYYLEDKNKRKFGVFNDGFTHLMSEKKLDYKNDISLLKNIGVNIFRLEFYEETPEDVLKIVTKFKNII